MENTTKTTVTETTATDVKVATAAVTSSNKKVGISSPWIETYKKIKALFETDEELEITDCQQLIGANNYAFSIGSRNTAKLKALEKILKSEYVFGNIKLFVNFEYQENLEAVTDMDYKTAFTGNGVLSDIQVSTNPIVDGTTFVLFAPEVIQFFNDDLGDYDGNFNGLAEDIAREIFKEQPNVKFSTDVYR